MSSDRTGSGKVVNVLIVGVGGQGIILAGELTALAALQAGLDVKKSEIHGMAQRGGGVNAQVRFGSLVRSPIIPAGETDVLLAFEKLEALRWLHLCGPNTLAVVNDQSIHSLTTGSGLEKYPADVDDRLRSRFNNPYLVPARSMARELGNPKVVNVILLGLCAALLDLPRPAWTEALAGRLPPKILEVNLKAFEMGAALRRS